MAKVHKLLTYDKKNRKTRSILNRVLSMLREGVDGLFLFQQIANFGEEFLFG